jgi:AraC-like DNA-binding protein
VRKNYQTKDRKSNHKFEVVGGQENADEMQKHVGSFDFILDAVSADHDINAYINLLRRDGNITLAGAPEKPLALSAFGLIMGRRSLSGSPIGGIAETQEMFDFCGEHNITADVEVIPIQKVNEAYERLLKSDVTRNAELLGMLAPQFEQELKQENVDENFPERVRGAIQQKLTGRRPTIEDIADALHISSRSLQRRLQDEGSSFQRVLEEARHQLARHYLNNSVLELNEAAYLLGYEDASSFVRAFRTWEGVPPARWRERQRARLAS